MGAKLSSELGATLALWETLCVRHCVRDQVGTCPCERPGKVDGERPDAELSRVGAAEVINRNTRPLKQ